MDSIEQADWTDRARMRLVCVLCLLAFAGCATTSLDHQEFLEVRTAHFDLISSFGEAQTRELARQLENFHLAARVVLRVEDLPDRFERLRVLAFDGRSLGRPFALRAEPAYFLPEPDAGLLVIRARGNWEQRVDRDLRHQIAHRLLRSHSPNHMPLWLEEGFAQAIGATRSTENQVRIGEPIPDYVAAVRDWRRTSVESVIRTADLSDVSRVGRELFEARAWSLVHVLRFDAHIGRGAGLRGYLDALERNQFRSVETEAALFGKNAAGLAERIDVYFAQKHFRIEGAASVNARAIGPLRPVSRGRSLCELGWLAVRIEKYGVARDYFERALEVDPDRAEALVGWARARVEPAAAEFEATEKLLLRADRIAPADATLQARLADVYATAAEFATDDEGRRRLARARDHYERSLEIDPDSVWAQVGLGLSFLVPGEPADEGIAWLKSAARLRPGSLGIELGLARLERKRGRLAEARVRAREVISRTHDERLRMRARALLEN